MGQAQSVERQGWQADAGELPGRSRGAAGPDLAKGRWLRRVRSVVGLDAANASEEWDEALVQASEEEAGDAMDLRRRSLSGKARMGRRRPVPAVRGRGASPDLAEKAMNRAGRRRELQGHDGEKFRENGKEEERGKEVGHGAGPVAAGVALAGAEEEARAARSWRPWAWALGLRSSDGGVHSGEQRRLGRAGR